MVLWMIPVTGVLLLEPNSYLFTHERGAVSQYDRRLYNLDQEIGEQTNLAAKNPEIVQRLQALAAEMSARVGGNEPSERRAAGVVENPETLYPTDATKQPKPATKIKKKLK